MKWYFDRVVIVPIVVTTILLFPIFNPISSFAMHDSTLDPNTWIMSDNSTDLGTFTFPSLPDSEGNETEETTIIEQPSQYQWLTYSDPILQFSIEHPSNWNITQDKDIITFEIPDTYDDFNVIVEPILTDHSQYARDTLNERRSEVDNLELIGLNETSINGQPATKALRCRAL